MNSAKRLLLYIEEIDTHRASSCSAEEMWEAIFSQHTGLDNMPSYARVLEARSCYNDLIELIFKIENDIRGIPDLNHALFTDPLKQFKAVFLEHTFTERAASFVGRITPEMIQSLKFIEDKLKTEFSEEIIKDGELDWYTEEFSKLLKSISESDMDLELRDCLLSSVSLILKSIRRYRLLGNEGIRMALCTVIGDTLSRKSQIVDAPPEDKSVFKLFAKITESLASKLPKKVLQIGMDYAIKHVMGED